VGEARSILLISSCTSLKAVGAGAEGVPAERLYAGEQHRRLMRGVSAFRAASTGYDLDLRILSAGYGLVRGSQHLQPYDASFSDLPRAELEQRAEELGIPRSVERALSGPHALVLLLLGEDYMRAASLGPRTRLGALTIAFGGAQLARRLAGMRSLKIVPAGKAEARRFSCGLVGLKGELGGRLLERLAQEPELVSRIAEPDLDLPGLLETPPEQRLEVAA
jgi:hypothetical protein